MDPAVTRTSVVLVGPASAVVAPSWVGPSLRRGGTRQVNDGCAGEVGEKVAPVAKVLVVDDHMGMRALICTLFEIERPDDYVIEAATAPEALDKFAEQRPDVVILDQMLGARYGLEDVATPILRERPETPIILFTAFLDNDLRRRAGALGVRECVTQDDLRDLPTCVGKLTDS